MSKTEKANGPPTLGRPASSWNYSYKLAFVAVLFSFVAYNTTQDDRSLPETYALCSRDGAKTIYTVDMENTRVECLLVRGSSVVGSGDLGGLFIYSSSSCFSVLNVDCPFLAKLKDEFTIPAVRYTPKGSIVIPGMSDSHCHILEYGASRQIPMAEARSVKGTFYSSYFTFFPS